MIKFILANWKTTFVGAGAFFTALGALLSSLAAGDTSHLLPEISAVITPIGLILAKDWNTTGGAK